MRPTEPHHPAGVAPQRCDDAPDSPDDDPRVVEAVEEYLTASESGCKPDRQQFVARHPEIAAVLTRCLDGLEFVRASAPRLGESAAPSTSVLSRPELAPAALGDFRLLREIGRGGMGIVYEAEQISLRRPVALKILPFAATLDPTQLQRFKNEALAAAQLHHSHIVPIFAVGCERGVHYYAMQYIEGQTLAALIRGVRQQAGLEQEGSSGFTQQSKVSLTSRSLTALLRDAPRGREPRCGSGPRREIPIASLDLSAGALATKRTVSISTAACSPADPACQSADSLGLNSTRESNTTKAYFRRVAELGVQAAEALEHAHQLGVIHRDVKPANLLLDARGSLWVTDFGLAQFQGDSRLTTTGARVGTLRYMSPEQASGRQAVDHRTDVYSLGATLYELLTLECASDASGHEDVRRQIAADEPRSPRRINPAIPIDLETIVLKAIAKAPDERYAAAQQLADDLRRFLDDQPILAKRPALGERLAKWTRRHRTVVRSAVALLLVAVVGLSAATFLIAREQAKTENAYRMLAAEQARTEAAFRAESRERERAQQNFQQARQMLDFFTQVSAEELAGQPGAQEVRKKLLEAALEYYQDFIDHCGDDPSTQADLAASYLGLAHILLHEIGSEPAVIAAFEQARDVYETLVRDYPTVPEFKQSLSLIYGQISVLKGGGHFWLLPQKPVQEELHLNDRQVARIAELVAAERDFMASFSGFPKMGCEESRALFEKRAKEQGEALIELLTADQSSRLLQIWLQKRGARALSDPLLTSALELSAEQQSRIREVQKNAWRAGQRWFRPHTMAHFRQLWHRTDSQLLGVLSDSQRERLTELLGEPFTAKLTWECTYSHSCKTKVSKEDTAVTDEAAISSGQTEPSRPSPQPPET